MNKKLLSIIWIDAVIAFFIPFGAALDASLTPFQVTGVAMPNYIGWILIAIPSLTAGASGLKSFLSTTVSDAKYDLAAAVPSNNSTPATPAQPKPTTT